jgi:uncharacterized damage-inducible protein DinB
MRNERLPEVWLRGPIEGIDGHLQPAAHALLQSVEEVKSLMSDFPPDLLWERPGGVASVGFHLRHLAGVVDRLFTYARGESLNDEQRRALAEEGHPSAAPADVAEMVASFRDCVDAAVEQLRRTPTDSLLATREVGRARLPSTVLGLVFHAAEHTQRHVGQLLVTARVLRDR